MNYNIEIVEDFVMKIFGRSKDDPDLYDTVVDVVKQERLNESTQHISGVDGINLLAIIK